jgi:hypothetical protein
VAYNLSSLRTTVQTRMRDTSFSSTALTQFANDTQREIFNNSRFRFMEASTTLTTTQGSQSLTSYPSDFQVALDLRITAPQNYANRLQYLPPEDFDKYFPQPTLQGTGVPMLWYEFGGTPLIFPQADGAAGAGSYTITMRYLKKPTELVGDADVPSVPEEFQEIMVVGMLKRAMMQKENFDQSFFFDQEFQRLGVEMNRRFSMRTSSPYQMRLNGR